MTEIVVESGDYLLSDSNGVEEMMRDSSSTLRAPSDDDLSLLLWTAGLAPFLCSSREGLFSSSTAVVAVQLALGR